MPTFQCKRARFPIRQIFRKYQSILYNPVSSGTTARRGLFGFCRSFPSPPPSFSFLFQSATSTLKKGKLFCNRIFWEGQSKSFLCFVNISATSGERKMKRGTAANRYLPRAWLKPTKEEEEGEMVSGLRDNQRAACKDRVGKP